MTLLRHQPSNNAPGSTLPARLPARLARAHLCGRLLCASLLALAPAAMAQSPVFTTGTQEAEPTGRLIVRYHAAETPGQTPRGSRPTTRGIVRARHQLRLERKLSNTKELVKPDTIDSDPRRMRQQLQLQAEQLSTQSDIAYAAVEYRRHPLIEPNDPLYRGSQNPGDQSYFYDGIYSMNAPGAWDITTGSESSVISIIDTGILPNHTDMLGRSVTSLGYDFVSADSPGDFFSANDGDGRDADPSDPGDTCNGFSSSWHGTSVASVAAGKSNNSEGMAGVDWNARLLHARALGICGGTDADIIDAVRWSAGLSVAGIPDNPTPANVVNLSLGGATECTRAWQDVIDELAALNIPFVLAAGNEALNALRSSPANCANVIAVGSSTPDGSIDSAFSNYGLKVAIATSGRDIVVASNSGFNASDENNNFYRTETGTSFSAAFVSGAISLMHSINPDLSPTDVRTILHESATPYASNTDCDIHHCGGGILHLARALSMLRDNSYSTDRDIAHELVNNEATSIAVGTEIDSTLSGYKDVRYFAVDVTERGLLRAESDATVNLYGYLLNPDLSVIAIDNNSGTAANFRVAALVEPGTYYIAVERTRQRLFDGETEFTLSTTLSDDTPDAFAFSNVTDAIGNEFVRSNIITLSGLQDASILTISNGFYSLNGDEPGSSPAVVNNGDTLQIITQSPGSANGSASATITVGAYSTNFTVTTADNRDANSGESENSGQTENSGGTGEAGETENTGAAGEGNNTESTSGGGLFDLILLFLLASVCRPILNHRRRAL